MLSMKFNFFPSYINLNFDIHKSYITIPSVLSKKMNIILSTNKNTSIPRGFKHYEMYPPHGQKVNNLILVINNDYELENCDHRIKYAKFKKLSVIIDIENSNNDNQVNNERLVKNLIPYNFDNHNLFVTNGCYKLPRIYKEIESYMSLGPKFWDKKYFVEFLIVISFLGLIIFLQCNTTTLLQTQISNSYDNITTYLNIEVGKFKEEIHNNFTSYISYELDKLKSENYDNREYIIINITKIHQDNFNIVEYNLNKLITANDETQISIVNSVIDNFNKLNIVTENLMDNLNTKLDNKVDDIEQDILEKIDTMGNTIIDKIRHITTAIYAYRWH